MRIRGGAATAPRAQGRWFVVPVMLLAGIGCLIGLTVVSVNAAELRSHAVRAVAAVEATSQDGRDKSYLIAFATPDGTPRTLWTTSLHEGTHVGDRVRITYDAGRIDNLQQGDGVDPSSAILAGVFLASLAVFFLWTARSAWRARPTGAAGTPARRSRTS